jgi:hypothetical protein
VREHDGNTDLSRLDVGAASADNYSGCAIGLDSTAPLEEVGTRVSPPFLDVDLWHF